MSKSKVHTSKGNNRKSHRNGIHKPKRYTTVSPIGVNQKYLRNCHISRITRNKKEEK